MKAGRWMLGALLIGAVGLGGFAWRRYVDTTPPPPPDYARAEAWLCRPGRADACAAPIHSTVLDPGGGIRKATYAPDPQAGIDCFYVYPTVSRAPGAYGPAETTPEIVDIARRQLARFAAVCRPFAPIYRQITLAGLPAAFRGDPRVTIALPYEDVRAAWNRYLDKDNGGRGIVLIGHSQGSRLLARLIAEEIEGKPVQARLVAAIIPGAAIDVPAGKDAGGTFKSIPLCGRPAQIGCVIAYSSFPAERPLPPTARFGGSVAPRMRDACVDPARVDGTLRLDAVLPLPPTLQAKFGTPFVDLPEAIGAACRWDGRLSVLAVTPTDDARLGEPMGALIDRVAGYSPTTGFHSLDIELALGTLIDLVDRKATAMPTETPR